MVIDESLHRLSEQSAAILEAGDRESICDVAVTSVERVLEESMAAIFLYDRSREALIPQAKSESISSEVVEDEYDDSDSNLWQVYFSNESRYIQATDVQEGIITDLGIDAGHVVSLGNHGVLTVGLPGTQAGRDDGDSLVDSDESVANSLVHILGSFVEITLDRTEREEGLQSVPEITRAVLTANNRTEVAETVLDRLPAALDLPVSTIWEWDEGQRALVPIATTPAAQELIGDPPNFDSDNSLAWQAFHEQELRVFEDVAANPDVLNPETPLRSEILVPIGEFGLLASGSIHRASFTPTERRLLETLGANIETAMRLVNRRQELELQDQVLARILRHNIRNDLTAVQGFATQIAEQSDGEIEYLANSIIDRCLGLEKTANHAREMQTVVRRSDQRENISLREAVGHAVKTADSAYPSAEIEAYLDVDATVSAHPDLTTAIRHLIENGIVHHPAFGDPEGETQHVTVKIFEVDGDVCVTIGDTASGIPRNEIEILDTQGETSLSHGSGVGLWIVDRIVEYSGATLDFETGDDGTTVRIRFD